MHGEPQNFKIMESSHTSYGCFFVWEGGDSMRSGQFSGCRGAVWQGKGDRRRKPVLLFVYTAFWAFCLAFMIAIPAGASDIFGIAKNAMQTVYTDVAGIATVAAVVCAAVCLFLMNFSKSGRTVDESRSWLKRIIICWAALMTLGAIVTYFEKIIPQSMFAG